MAVGVGQTEYSPGFLLMKLIWLVTIISGKFEIMSKSRQYNSWSKFGAQLKLAGDFQNVSCHNKLKNTQFSGEKYCEFSADSARNARQIFSKMVMFGHLYLTFFKSQFQKSVLTAHSFMSTALTIITRCDHYLL